ncbi:hypothetical protein E2C01_075344 [Portunus trituberculatus]|uniref:Uncharacterized protein n=1 Tax=Portunus trituberculatus TaxID=210409 RepID=A0A5B7IFL9_PORTR|nr:hypothetical protein [Portunus trituberculatus]
MNKSVTSKVTISPTHSMPLPTLHQHSSFPNSKLAAALLCPALPCPS